MQQLISDYLVTLLEGLQDEDNNNLFGSVVAEIPGETFQAATPLAMILPSNMTAEYGTTAQNDRAEGFSIYILIPLESGDSRAQDWRNIRTLSDAVRNAIDQTEDLGGLTSEDNKSHVYGVKPTSAGTTTADSGNGETLIAEVSVIVKYTYNFR